MNRHKKKNMWNTPFFGTKFKYIYFLPKAGCMITKKYGNAQQETQKSNINITCFPPSASRLSTIKLAAGNENENKTKKGIETFN